MMARRDSLLDLPRCRVCGSYDSHIWEDCPNFYAWFDKVLTDTRQDDSFPKSSPVPGCFGEANHEMRV